MRPFARFWERCRNDERGVTLVIVVICMGVLMPFALAFSLELGEDTVVNRSLQSAADAGALNAARYLNFASSAEVQTEGLLGVSDNYPGGTATVTEGTWSGGTFTACSVSCTAVKVVASGSVKHIAEPGSSSLSRTAIATLSPPDAGFSIGTYLATVSTQQSAILNSLLSVLTPGTSLSLSAVSFEGLANANITLQQLINASGGALTTSNVLSATTTPGSKLISWISAALTSQGNTTAVSEMASILSHAGAPTSIELCKLISYDGSGCTVPQSALTSSVNVLQLLTTDAELANGASALSLGTGLSLPGVTSSSLTLSAVQPIQVGYGPVGTSISTQQVTGNLQLCVGACSGLLSVAVLNVPLGVATGTAAISQINCSNTVDQSVGINVNTAPVGTSIGVTLANIPAASLPITVTAVNNDGLTFLGTNIPPTASSISAQTNPQIATATSLGITGTLAGLGSLVTALTSDLVPILQAVGANAGPAQVTVNGVTCNYPTLVA